MMCDRGSGRLFTVKKKTLKLRGRSIGVFGTKEETRQKHLFLKSATIKNQAMQECLATQSKVFYSVGIRKFLAKWTRHIESQVNFILQHDLSYLLFRYFSNNSSQIPI